MYHWERIQVCKFYLEKNTKNSWYKIGCNWLSGSGEEDLS